MEGTQITRVLSHDLCHILLVRRKLWILPTLPGKDCTEFGSLEATLEVCLPQLCSCACTFRKVNLYQKGEILMVANKILLVWLEPSATCYLEARISFWSFRCSSDLRHSQDDKNDDIILLRGCRSARPVLCLNFELTFQFVISENVRAICTWELSL